jgi:hypothetical protein
VNSCPPVVVSPPAEPYSTLTAPAAPKALTFSPGAPAARSAKPSWLKSRTPAPSQCGRRARRYPDLGEQLAAIAAQPAGRAVHDGDRPSRPLHSPEGRAVVPQQEVDGGAMTWVDAMARDGWVPR